MQGSKLNFLENHLLGTYNCEMVAIKQILKKNSQTEGATGGYFSLFQNWSSVNNFIFTALNLM